MHRGGIICLPVDRLQDVSVICLSASLVNLVTLSILLHRLLSITAVGLVGSALEYRNFDSPNGYENLKQIHVRTAPALHGIQKPWLSSQLRLWFDKTNKNKIHTHKQKPQL